MRPLPLSARTFPTPLALLPESKSFQFRAKRGAQNVSSRVADGMIVSNASFGCPSCPALGDGNVGGGATGEASPSLTRTGQLVVALCLGVIGTLGFLNNFIVITLFCRYRMLRSPINCMLVSISVSDLLVSVLGTPFSFAASTQGRWLIGRSGCVWYGFVNACLGKFIFLSWWFPSRSSQSYYVLL